jgi:hypothetical protein
MDTMNEKQVIGYFVKNVKQGNFLGAFYDKKPDHASSFFMTTDLDRICERLQVEHSPEYTRDIVLEYCVLVEAVVNPNATRVDDLLMAGDDVQFDISTMNTEGK